MRSKAQRRKDRDAAFKEVGAGRPPDFEMAPLTGFAPSLLTPNSSDGTTISQMRRVTLLLALAFNDLKDLLWAHNLLGHFNLDRPPPAVPSAVVGQLVGMQEFFLRHALGAIAELGVLINSPSKQALFASTEFGEALALVKDVDARRRWADLTKEFRRETTPLPRGAGVPKSRLVSPTSAFIHFVRDKFAFHYAPLLNEEEQLGRGYDERFARSTQVTSKAFASLGVSMERSRFFFADAAVQEAMTQARTEAGTTDQDLSNTIRLVNETLRHVVEGLLKYLVKRDAAFAASEK